ncbi:tyrosine-type recombinase/integrase [Pseudomonas sp. R5(2019)]|uniref:tyrosine-type recombinase/integrase n=1 Tax=Pseudomonas sp. R5(2019) TaxID=2697566 RepID=UPI001412B65F|nr:tyrosine-type recombinase/integrase [Pseudomonas sp. R5(2019)]NBA95266.1 tyrosine-type recombinase/integrase [Pseudomonas sp. R5(2019)]
MDAIPAPSSDIDPASIADPLSAVAEHSPAGNIIGAKNDFEAVRAWMKAKGLRSRHTFKSYKTEAKKLLIWMMEKRLNLNSLNVEHVHDFYNHLGNPPKHWIRPAKAKSGEKLADTQLLRAAVSNESICFSRTVLIGLCRYLIAAGYMRLNPFELSHKPTVVVHADQDRFLSVEAWDYLWMFILGMANRTPLEKKHADRVRWVFALFYHTGLRCEEVANGRMSDFVRRDITWQLKVVGKGSKARLVTINSMLLAELMRFRKICGLPVYPLPAESFPLVPRQSYKGGVGVSPRTIQAIITEVGQRAAASCLDPQIAEQVAAMSAHWLRHTNATHRLMVGASLETTQDELGHADPRTTRIYAKTSSVARKDDAEKLAELHKGKEQQP